MATTWNWYDLIKLSAKPTKPFHMKKILFKVVSYRFYNQTDDDGVKKYYIQFSKDEFNNPLDLEITYHQFIEMREKKAINHMAHTVTELPTLVEKMPAYCYHNITVDLYELTN